jgi:large repetitive protein
MPHHRRYSPSLRVFTALLLVAQALVVVGSTAVFTLGGPAPTAEAHSVAQIELGVSMSPETQNMLIARGTGIEAGDVLEWIVKFTPVDNGSEDGPAGYVTAYVPEGMEVVGASVVQPQGTTFVDIPVAPPGGIPGGAGDINYPWLNPFDGTVPDPYNGGAWEIGTLPQFYGDTGIFYSTDPRTAKYAETTIGDGADPDLVPLTVDNGYRTVPTACGQLLGFVDATECRTHNLWDAAMTNAFGTKPGDLPIAAPAPSSSQPSVDGSGRGRGPYLAGSPMAGPDVFYKYDYTGTVGPWHRIAYPGSTIGFGPPNDPAVPDYAYTPTSGGITLDESSPLPAAANAVRWAVGGLLVGELKYVKLRLRVLPSFDDSICHPVDAEVFGGDAGLENPGKDTAWRYHEPAPGNGNTCLVVNKSGPAQGAKDEIVPYTITVANISGQTLTNVVVRDDYNGDFEYQSATPVPASVSGGIVTWPTIASMAPGSVLTYTVNLKLKNTGAILNRAMVDSDQTAEIENGIQTNTGAYTDMSHSKTVAPATAEPGATVTYTVTLTNDGGIDATGLTFTDTLDPHLTYVAGSSTVNGVPVANPTGSGSGPLTWSLGTLGFTAPGNTKTLQFQALVGSSTPRDACYYNDYITTWSEPNFYNPLSLYGVDDAELCVPEATIGDYVWLDADGGGDQDAGESGISGVTLDLWRDVDGSGTVNAGDTYLGTATTDGGGAYVFDDLGPGSYLVDVTDTGGVLAGKVATAGSDPHPVTLSSGQDYTAADFGYRTLATGIQVEKSTNGQDADTAPGPSIPVGDPVTWTYTVTNPGEVPLSNVSATDSDAGVTPSFQSGDTDGDSELDLTETWVYTASGTATAGQYANTATATGTPPTGPDVTDTDDSHYFGVDPAIVVEKSTNGQDADTAPGPYVPVGDPVTWTYTVTNPGNVALTAVTVVDDQGVTVTYQSGDTDTDGALDPAETWTYQATGSATAGQYANTATATATPPTGPEVTDTDDSHYYGVDARITVEKSTNGQDADTAPGPLVPVGDPVTWTYTVTNPGNVPLSPVTVVDDQGVTVTYQSGDTDTDGSLDPAETWTYTASGTAVAGQYANTATATGTPPGGLPDVTDTDDSHYYGSDARITVEKSTNGQDADTAPGPYVPVGSVVTWAYTVTNPGNVSLAAVSVVDDQGVGVSFVGGDTDGDGTLDPGETWHYDGLGTAVAGQYANTATATATPPGDLPDVTDTDDSHYFGVDPEIVVEKSTNGQDADTAPGPVLAIGSTVTWTYTVTNPGNVALTAVTVVDDQGVTPVYQSGDTDTDGALDPTETWTYQATGTATAGQYANTATATGTPPVGPDVTDTDDSHYHGSDARIVVEKSTNGQDADTAPGPLVPVGDPVTWTYTVTNPGNFALTAVTVVDDQGVTPIYQSGDTDTDGALDPTETWTYQATGTATAGQYANTATATGTPPVGPDVTDTDDSHYYGVDPEIVVEKATNGQDADTAPGPYVLVGDPVTWTYTVTNPGNVPLTSITVVDDQGVTPVYQSGDTNGDGALDPAETWTYTASGTAVAGQYANTATATGTPPTGPDVTDTDDSHYYGVDPAIVVEKATNGQDADTAPGPYVPVGDPVTWTYTVTNPGNVPLTSVTVIDDQGVTPIYQSGDTDTDGALDPAETWTYTATGTATAGQYANTATATGTPPVGPDVTDTDDSHYHGSDARIVVEKATNGQDADTAPGPYVPVGDPVTWTYTVTNPGNVPLTSVTVVDDQGVTPIYQSGDTDTDGALDPTETWTYTASGTATAGQYANTATATGAPPGGLPDVTDTDDSHYYGSDAEIVVEKSTNGQDADTPTGPGVLVGATLTWEYVVTNPGNVPLSSVTVDDSDAGVTPGYESGDTDGDSLLDPDETWIYQATGTAIAGQYANTATATGTPPVGPDVTDTDDSHYYGADAGIDIAKRTNGADAPAAPGPHVPVGDPVTWTYVVTNTGNVALSGISVTDSDAGVTPVFQSGDTDLDGDLDVTETWTYSAAGTATAGQYHNTGEVTGTPPVGPDVGDSDDSHYYGVDARITVEKATNGQDADTAPGPYVPVGDPVTWTYTVTNPGNVALTAVTVVDDQGVTPVYQSGDTDTDGALDPAETWTYTATGTATAGQYANTATATGTPPVGPDVTDTDDSHYHGSDARIVVEKSTNGQDADTAPGPLVPVGDTVTWTYEVTNPGNVALTSVSVVDDQGVTVSFVGGDTDGDGALDPAETWSYDAFGAATAGQYANTATATGTPPVGPDVTDTDDSHYYGVDPEIVVEKSTNGSDADTAPGPYVLVGDPVTWTYVVTNPGNVPLTSITVVDNQGLTPIYQSGDTNTDGALDPAETWTYTATGTATAGQYANTATATGTPPVGPDVTDTDDSHYHGVDPEIVVEKSTNGSDADTAPGPYVLVGDPVTWTYTVTNPGNVPLTSVSVIDDQGVTPIYQSGDTNGDSALDPTETWTYTATGTATAGQYANTATATGTPPVGPDVTDTDDSHYYGVDPEIVVEKSTNGSDADTAPGPYVLVGDPVTWTYTVTNPGNVPLTSVSVIDDQGVTPIYQSGDTNGDSALDPTETWTYTASGTATAGQYANTATVTGTPPGGLPDATDTDDSHYHGVDARITVEKSTNGADADTAPGPVVAIGGVVTWTYTVTNPGNVALTSITVVDDQGVTPVYQSGDTDGDSELDVTETWVYTASGTAVAGQYANTATVTGTPPGGLPDATDTDDSHYHGSDARITVEKSTNGSDADAAPGPLVTIGDPVTWTYTVTNPGNVALASITVIDDQGVTPIYQSGDTDTDGSLDPAETWTYQATGTATAGQYANTATATGTPPVGPDVTDTDDSHYYGVDARITVEKATNGQDADTTPGPYVPVGDPVTWTYTVTNPGNVPLTSVSVIDDQGVTPIYQSGDTDTDGALDPAETWTYQATGTATAGQYANTATATGTPPVGPDVTDTDDSHYHGTDPRIVVEKATNGQDADTAPGPYVPVGDPVTWTYTVTNPGNVALTSITVVDDQGLTPVYQSGDTDTDGALDPDETWTYQATGTATAGQYANTATVTGTPPGGLPDVTDTDDSHYYGSVGAVGDRVWDDLDRDGVQDVGEPGITGVAITLIGAGPDGVVGTPDDVTHPDVTTGADGLYGFGSLVPGTYRVERGDPPTGYGATTPESVTVTIGLDEQRLDLDFGLSIPASIGDRVWSDADGDGIQDAGEPGLSGVTVRLYTGADPVTPVAITATDVAGGYTFAGLIPGDYVVEFVLPAGYTFSPQGAGTDPAADADADITTGRSTPITLLNGETLTAIDAGMTPPAPARLGDLVWNDLDADGVQDAGEPGIGGVEVRLFATTEPTVALASTVTDATGTYVFDGLDAATDYIVEVALPAGALGYSPAGAGSDIAADSDVTTTGRTAAVDLAPGQVDLGRDAGIVFPAALGDRVWFDVDGDGVQDAGEPGIGGVAVRLLDAGGATLATTTTREAAFGTDPAAGTYRFDGLRPGGYTVVVDAASLPTGLAIVTFDRDGGGDGSALVLLTGGAAVDDVDFGYAGVGIIGDTVWVDADGDGAHDPSPDEPGLGGVEITVTWGGRDGIVGNADDHTFPVQVTDGNGNYLFSRLPMGSFRIAVGSADGYGTAGPTVFNVALTLEGGGADSVLFADFPFQVLGADELPRTGFDAGILAAVSLLLLLAGATLLAATRRRTRHR